MNYLSKTIYEFQILPEILSMLGHSVAVVDYNDSWIKETNPSRWWSGNMVYSDVHRAYDTANITLHRPAMIRLPVLSRISGAVASGLQVAALLKRCAVDVILMYGLPTVGIQTLIAARKYGVPVVFRAIDVTHKLVPYRLLITPTRILEKLVFNRVALNIALTPLLQNYIESYGVAHRCVRLLPSGVDTALFAPGPKKAELLARLGIGPSAPVVLFMGTIYPFSGLDRVIRGWSRVLAAHPCAKLVIVGAGEDQDRLTALSTENGVASHVIFAGMLPYSVLPDVIRASDVCINPFEINGITEKILPTKLFQYLACAKPVIATRLPGTVSFLSGAEDGIVYAEPDETVAALIKLLGDAALRERLGRRGTAAAQKYDWTEIANQMTSLLAELVK